MTGRRLRSGLAREGGARSGAAGNGREVGRWKLERSGLFIVEADLPESDEYHIDIYAAPPWTVPTDDRVFTVNLSMIRLVPPE